jgi:hypothetical protein
MELADGSPAEDLVTQQTVPLQFHMSAHVETIRFLVMPIKHTVKNRYPLPLINDLIRQVSKAKVFTALDLRGAYNHVQARW